MQPRTQVQAWSQERLWVLLWCGFLRKLEQGICTHGSQYRQVTKGMDHLLCRMPRLMGLQTSISNHTVHYRGQVHPHVTGTTWCHSHHEPTTGNEGAKLQGHLYWTLCLLQSIWRYCRSPGTCKASKTTPKDQAHKCLLSSFLWTRTKGAYKDLPHQRQRPDCWCTHKSSGTKWLPALLPPYVQCVTSLRHQSDGVLCNWNYFGTYLGYLPMILMSLQCDIFQLIPVFF